MSDLRVKLILMYNFIQRGGFQATSIEEIAKLHLGPNPPFRPGFGFFANYLSRLGYVSLRKNQIDAETIVLGFQSKFFNPLFLDIPRAVYKFSTRFPSSGAKLRSQA